MVGEGCIPYIQTELRYTWIHDFQGFCLLQTFLKIFSFLKMLITFSNLLTFPYFFPIAWAAAVTWDTPGISLLFSSSPLGLLPTWQVCSVITQLSEKGLPRLHTYWESKRIGHSRNHWLAMHTWACQEASGTRRFSCKWATALTDPAKPLLISQGLCRHSEIPLSGAVIFPLHVWSQTFFYFASVRMKKPKMSLKFNTDI